MENFPEDDRKRLPPVWDLSQERVYTKDLLNKRINFFLIFFSLVIGGALNAHMQVHMNIILWVGSIIASFLAVPIFYTQTRCDKIMRLIKDDQSHPYTIIANMAGNRFKINVSALMSYKLITVCIIVLFACACLSSLGYLTVPS